MVRHPTLLTHVHLIRNNWLTELLVPLEEIQYIVRLSFPYPMLMLVWLALKSGI